MTQKSHRTSESGLVRNFATTAASSILAMPIALLAEVLLARSLGAEQRGVYALAVLIPNTAFTFCMFGLATSHTVYAGKYPEKRGAIAFQSLVFAGLMGMLILAFYGYLLWQRPGWFRRFETVGTFNHLLASFIVVTQLVTTYLQAGVLGANRIQVVNIGTILRPVMKTALIGCLVCLLGLGVTGGIAAQLGCLVVLAAYMVVATAIQVPVSTWKPDFGFFKKALRFGVKDHVAYMAFYAATHVDTYMIAFLLPDSDRALGHYSMAIAFSLALWLLPASLQTSFLPHLSVTQKDRSILVARTARLLCVALAPIMVFCGVASPLITVVLGQDYAGSVTPFVLLLPGLLVFGATRPYNSYLLYIEKPAYSAVCTVAGLVANVILNLWAIPRFGIAGAAMASTISYCLIGLATAFCFKYEARLPIGQLILRPSDVAEVYRLARRVLRRGLEVLSGGRSPRQ